VPSLAKFVDIRRIIRYKEILFSFDWFVYIMVASAAFLFRILVSCLLRRSIFWHL